jgi:hypothetical protein
VRVQVSCRRKAKVAATGRGHGGITRGRERPRKVYRIAPGVLSLVAELRGHERQAAEELEQRKTRVEERKPLDASPAAITLAMIFTAAEQVESGNVYLPHPAITPLGGGLRRGVLDLP